MAQHCRTEKKRVQVALTTQQIRSLFAAVNTAGLLSAGMVDAQPADCDALCDAIAVLEAASGIGQSDVDEWPVTRGAE